MIVDRTTVSKDELQTIDATSKQRAGDLIERIERLRHWKPRRLVMYRLNIGFFISHSV